MFNLSDQSLPFTYSFRDEQLRKLFRENIVGGIVNCFHRHICLTEEDFPKASKYSANGERYKSVVFLDFNS